MALDRGDADTQWRVPGGVVGAVVDAPKKTSTGAMGGPFDLGRPEGCPKSWRLGSLLAQIALIRGDHAASGGLKSK